MKAIKLDAELHFQTTDERPIVSLVLKTKNEEDMKVLQSMAFGDMDDRNGIRYCHINTVYPHSLGGNGNGEYEITMSVNHNPWTNEDVPSEPS